MKSEEKIAHLGMIQGVISRLAGNSFLLKGWTITLISAVYLLAAKDSNRVFVLIGFLPFFAFWILDAYFLRLEKLFRVLYDDVANNQTTPLNFSMKIEPYEAQVGCYLNIFFSQTLLVFYVPILILLLALSVVFYLS